MRETGRKFGERTILTQLSSSTDNIRTIQYTCTTCFAVFNYVHFSTEALKCPKCHYGYLKEFKSTN